jgi:predicted PurR-regulated permease PerM
MEAKMQQPVLSKSPVAFFAFFTGIAILVIAMLYPFLGAIIFSLTMSIVLKPLYDRLLAAFKGRSGLAVSITLLIALLVPITIAWFAGSLMLRQISSSAASAESSSTTTTNGSTATVDTQAIVTDLGNLLEKLTASGQVDKAKLQASVANAIAQTAKGIVSLITGIGFSLLNLFLTTIIFLMIVAPLLLNFDSFISWIQQVSPFPVDITNVFFEKVRLMTLAMFASIFIIAILQGLVMGAFFWLGGAPQLPVLILLSMIAAMLPFGCSIVAIPVGIFMIATGDVVSGLIVILGYVLIVSNIDTFLRPALVPKGAALTYALTLLATLGGLQMFGFMGVIYGPVIMVLFVTAIQVYRQYYGPRAVTDTFQME